MSTAPPSQRPPQDAGGGVDRKTIYNHDWNAERRLSEEVRHLRSAQQIRLRVTLCSR
jgi:hypothetical protein